MNENNEKEVKKHRFRQNSKIWLQRAESFRLLLEENSQVPADLLQHERNYQTITGRMMTEAWYGSLRSRRYFLWLQKAESLMHLDSENNPLVSGLLRLIMSLDYKKLYDTLLFEFHQYLSRACFCRLALQYGVNLNPVILQFELDSLIEHIKNLLKQNRGLSKQPDFKAIYLHAYRSALMDLCLYYDITANVLDAPLFSLAELVRNSVSRKIKQLNQYNSNNP